MVERSVTASSDMGIPQEKSLDESFEYVSTPKNKRSSSSEEETIKWSHNHRYKKPSKTKRGEGRRLLIETQKGRIVTRLERNAEVQTQDLVGVATSEHATVQEGPKPVQDIQPLTGEEINILRAQMRYNIQSPVGIPQPVVPKIFQRPHKHPIFDGNCKNLESFIMEMELTHGEWIAGEKGEVHNPQFLSQLVEYFPVDSAVRIWYSLYASERMKTNKDMSWSNLIKALRQDYGRWELPGTLFNEYWNLKQESDTVQEYITKKKSAAFQAKEYIVEELLMYGFVSGLRPNIQNHVIVLQPDSVEHAQKLAIAFENNYVAAVRRSEPRGVCKEEKEKSGKRKRATENNTKVLNSKQKQALEELRDFRRGKCFKCGSTGHMQDKCAASSADMDNHRERTNTFRNRISGK